ncbi:MAG: YqcC family protein [Vibrio sp.]
MHPNKTLSDVLNLLHDELVQLELWEDVAPAEDALQSDQPFALDTLKPTQWLQWVFLPKMRELVESGSEVPTGFEISPYFEHAMPKGEQRDQLLAILNQLDEIVK